MADQPAEAKRVADGLLKRKPKFALKYMEKWMPFKDPACFIYFKKGDEYENWYADGGRMRGKFKGPAIQRICRGTRRTAAPLVSHQVVA